MSLMKTMIKNLIGKLILKKVDSVPESQMAKIRQMHSTLPDNPQKGRTAPEWKKGETAGPNGESSS